MRDFTLETLKQAITTLGITVLMADPRMLLVFAKTTSPESDSLHSLRDIRGVGALIPKETLDILKPHLHPDCIVSQVYAATETGTISALPYNYRKEHDPASVGFQWPGTTIK